MAVLRHLVVGFRVGWWICWTSSVDWAASRRCWTDSSTTTSRSIRVWSALYSSSCIALLAALADRFWASLLFQTVWALRPVPYNENCTDVFRNPLCKWNWIRETYATCMSGCIRGQQEIDFNMPMSRTSGKKSCCFLYRPYYWRN